MLSLKLIFLCLCNVGKVSSKFNVVMNSIVLLSVKIVFNIVDVVGFLDDVGDVVIIQCVQMIDFQVKGQQINEMNVLMQYGIEEVLQFSVDNLFVLMVSCDSFKIFV